MQSYLEGGGLVNHLNAFLTCYSVGCLFWPCSSDAETGIKLTVGLLIASSDIYMVAFGMGKYS